MHQTVRVLHLGTFARAELDTAGRGSTAQHALDVMERDSNLPVPGSSPSRPTGDRSVLVPCAVATGRWRTLGAVTPAGQLHVRYGAGGRSRSGSSRRCVPYRGTCSSPGGRWLTRTQTASCSLTETWTAPCSAAPPCPAASRR